METRTLIDARHPRWGSADRRCVELECKFEELSELGFIPFTASRDDSTLHGAAIFAFAKQGRFGPIAEFQQMAKSQNDGAIS